MKVALRSVENPEITPIHLELTHGDGEIVIEHCSCDIMHDAMKQIIKKYKRELHREPYIDEMYAIIAFCNNRSNLKKRIDKIIQIIARLP